MKKAIVLALGLMAAQAYAAPLALCADGIPASGAGVTTVGTNHIYAVQTGSFVVSGFAIKCSKNVHLAKDENAIAIVIGAASAKGKNRFQGSSGGGAITSVGVCAGAGGLCTATDATTGLDTLLLAATY